MLDKLEKIDLKQIYYYILGLIGLVLVISLIPVLIYSVKFNDYGISDIPSDWAEFSTFLSGTTGVLLSFFAVLFALISILITTIVAKAIQTRDFEFNQKQKELELKITHSQNKPYPYLDLTNYPTKTSIILQNMGLGTLIVTKLTVRYKSNEEFNSFRHLFEKKLEIDNTNGLKIDMNTAPNHVLGPNIDKSLLDITSDTSNNDNPKLKHQKFRDLLKDCEVIMEYQDLFENKFEFRKELSFLI